MQTGRKSSGDHPEASSWQEIWLNTRTETKGHPKGKQSPEDGAGPQGIRPGCQDSQGGAGIPTPEGQAQSQTGTRE